MLITLEKFAICRTAKSKDPYAIWFSLYDELKSTCMSTTYMWVACIFYLNFNVLSPDFCLFVLGVISKDPESVFLLEVCGSHMSHLLLAFLCAEESHLYIFWFHE